jgi:membrane protease subunit HflC
MKRNSLTLIVGSLLLLIFVTLLFCFQVRQTEVALVTRFGKPTRDITDPGLYFKLPWPIERVQKFDKRTQNLDGKFEETTTQDKINVLVSVYAGWNIADPKTFRVRFGDSLDRARQSLDEMIRSHQNAVIAGRQFSELISTDPARSKFTEIEKAIMDRAQPEVLTNYGIQIKFLGIKRIGLPDAVTAKVLDRMRAERERVVRELTAQGDARAAEIQSEAASERAETLARAEARAIELRGEAEREASNYLKVFNQEPALADFLTTIWALETSLKGATLLMDQRTTPFHLLDSAPKTQR